MSLSDIPKLLEETRQLMQNEYDKLNAETGAMHKKCDWFPNVT